MVIPERKVTAFLGNDHVDALEGLVVAVIQLQVVDLDLDGLVFHGQPVSGLRQCRGGGNSHLIRLRKAGLHIHSRLSVHWVSPYPVVVAVRCWTCSASAACCAAGWRTG